MTQREIERLAVLETKVEGLSADVTEVKADVKDLITSVADIKAALQIRDASKQAHDRAGADLGVWVRSAVPWFIAGAAFLTSVAHTIFGLGG